jgi:uroporphyrinogen-III decarboxylase
MTPEPKEQKAPEFHPSPDYLAREQRFNEAARLEEPDRVPVASLASLFMVRYAGLTNAQGLYEYEESAQAIKETMQALDWDMAPLHFTLFPGPVMEKLGLKTFKWPGKHFKENLPYQFVEDEYMLAEEYDEFLNNPGGFVVRKLMPRMSETLEPLGMLPPMIWFSSGYALLNLGGMMAGAPPMLQMFEQLAEVGREMNEWNAVQRELTMDLMAMGYPPVASTVFTQAPFDWVSDHFRGLRGTMLDMYRHPDKLKATMEMLTEFLIQSAIAGAEQTKTPRIFIPLHRGAGGFMSNEQFAEFYWPSLKKMLLALIDADLMPMPFFEGDYTPRLEFLAELPPGKVIGHFDVIDKQQFKEVLGDRMCFWGNVPAQLLVTGTEQQTEDYVKELIDTLGDGGGLIVDGAVDGIPPEAKPENVDAMTESVFEHGVY